MANISLESAIRTCKVLSGWASKLESDRFENSEIMVCPVWNGMDQYGRMVCPDSWNTKTAGCNSSDDRVTVENALRPQYMEYVNLDADGIRGHIYDNTMQNLDMDVEREALKQMNKIAGSTGLQNMANVRSNCATKSGYTQAMQQMATQQRKNVMVSENYKANIMRRGGM